MKKIVYISTSTVPSRAANSIHVMKMCEALSKNGNPVTLIAAHRANSIERGVSDIFEFYGICHRFNVIQLRWFDGLAGRFFYSVGSLLNLYKVGPDYVYCRDLVGCVLATFLGFQTIFEAHSPIETKTRTKRWLIKKFLGSGNLKKIILITKALRIHYVGRYPEVAGKCYIAPDCASAISSRVRPIKVFGGPDKVNVGYVGHLYRGRGMDIVTGMAKACDWADFHFVGGEEKDIEYWEKKTRHYANCFFYGFVSPSESERYRISFDILLAPYQGSVAVAGGVGNTAPWMSPLKIFEYMAAKKPIVCSDLPVLKEVLTHQYNSLLCCPDNIDEWVCALEDLRDSPELRQRLGEAAYKDFSRFYTWESRASRVIQ